jgi:hypothetical protein
VEFHELGPPEFQALISLDYLPRRQKARLSLDPNVGTEIARRYFIEGGRSRVARAVSAGQLNLTGGNRHLVQVQPGTPFTFRSGHYKTGALNHRLDSPLE